MKKQYVKQAINYQCFACHEEEAIPYDGERDFDIMNGGDPT
ncbi:hypothetical protein [Metabacillus arenae]|nr:hypothetical protein [Metabacillus arenae]